MNSRFDSTAFGEPAIYKANFAMAFISATQVLGPAIIAAATLFTLCLIYDVSIDRQMAISSIIAATLVVMMVRTNRQAGVPVGNERVLLVVHIIQRWLIVLGLLLLIAYALKQSSEFSRRVVLTWAVVTPALIVVFGLFMQEMLLRAMADVTTQSSALFVGVNDASTALASRLRKNPRLNMRVAGFFDDRSMERLGTEMATPLLGRLPDVVEHVRSHQIDVIYIALPIRHIKRVMNLIDELRDTTASIYYVPDIHVFDLIQARTTDILGVPVIAMCETPFSGYRAIAKRIFDLSITLSSMPVVLPLLLVIAMLVRMSSPGSVLFRQRRYGLDGREIVVYKFRTMRVVEDGQVVQQATRDDPRVTPIGRVLRKYSLDELPQLFNVIGGSMSLVGPRPHAVAHNEQYRKLIKGYMIRHKAPPGITGLAQINGCRGETARLEEMQARVDYDLEYLRRWSVRLDIKILIATIFQIGGGGKAY